MASGTVRHWLWIAAVLVACVSVLAGWVTWRATLDRVMEETARRGDNVLQLASSSLTGQLDRFERLPALIAEQALIRQLAADPGNQALVAEANQYLERIQRMLDASDIYLMVADGLTIAASNHLQEKSFVGENFAFRPYFSEAMLGRTGRFFALGTTSLKRGYYFGAPVRGEGDIIGVLVFKVDLDAIEQTWLSGDYAVLVTDPDGVIFLSSRAEWLFHVLRPLDAAASARIAATRRYADTPIGLLDVADDHDDGTRHLLRIGSSEFVQRDMSMPRADWQVHVLIDTVAARREAMTAAVVALLSVGVMALLGAMLWQRRLRLTERFQLQAEAQANLERRVEMRTAELKQAQADLVQAGKLAALGQMSAALSHEFNQPLAAARTYADNALVLLDRGRSGEARANIDRIINLISRLGTLSGHLRSFARKPGQKLGAVALPDVIEAAVEIATLRLKAAKAELTLRIAPDLPLAIAGPVRLQQVLVNILSNAADAAEGEDVPRITLDALAGGDHVVIRVSDNGPGVSEALRPRIFDPFFSTKGVGKGLGLGLSISYNIIKDFGGDIEVASSQAGGAVFTIRLLTASDENAVQISPAMPSAAE
ncbi:MAG: two-component sensor histidine kinase [Hoeflea sp.]|uniref:sensor histidine kinase n=1 Tax=Hoeflea sp. TaxID=1940281 RepID=UPI001DC2C55C|nr:ATP-binding protein [Hoeflea sp.]MBU4528166.1 two-component sensor histidine kinase [Alphaproteobacteria bacterium]MBU4543762.1 two-component sensor histidine kinase [Alphaproteobacteria bacterium]MBU4548629.1 two-component sensor histidine kinase [Alphaproteobacteria bacterium]MBV1725795.1 two-component sensor histidine kinase [Hoeflea sp.]MBV1762151.1 two-component sensor histidine kinase [Hoeflea sp.]